MNKDVLEATGMGLVLGAYNDSRQVRQQEKLQKLQIEGSKQMGLFNQELNKQMWDYTNYGNQVKHLKEAGLNPALLYGSGGGGGATAAGGSGSVTGATATQGGGNETGMAMQLELLKAQKANIEADTAQKQAVTAKTSGVDTEKTITETELNYATLEFQNLKNKIQGETIEDQIDYIKHEAYGMIHDAYRKSAEKQVAEGTVKAKIAATKQAATNAILEAQIMKQGIALDAAKIKEISNNIFTKLQELDIQRESQQVTREGIKASKENMEKLTETMLWQAGIQATGQIVGDIVDIWKFNKTRMDKNKPIFKSETKIERPGMDGSKTTTTESRTIPGQSNYKPRR